jgi:EAL domain-containing protein (putative c-di-GMP-specific phosphodiesterase class I)/CheY-like chemotaxis protein
VQDYFTPQQISRHYGKLLRQAVSQNADLRHAIDSLETANGLPEFQVYYQPIVSLRTGRIISLESLLRWHHPVRGLVCPAEFISAAEETGLIVPLGWWLLNTVCQQLQTWHAHFPQIPLRISINLSSQQFFQSDLVPQIVALLKTYGLDGSCLMLEIKDRTVMEDAAATTALLLQLQAHNIQVCIDDFGASHSALEYLHRFPVNALKADRALVSRIEMNPETVKLLETIAILAKDLGMQAIAGGVETSDQLHRLKEIGFEQGQGYLFSEPVPAETIETLLTSQQQVNLTNITGVSMESSEKSPQQDAPLVLLIDDDRSMRAILKRMIMNEGYRVVEATNGEQGIETYKASRPDLVLLDAMMPQMDGFTCCTRLQQLNAETALLSDSDRLGSATWQAPPVLMITALDDVESVDKAFTAGATDYITKPINWAVFRQKIRQLLKKRNGKHWARL